MFQIGGCDKNANPENPAVKAALFQRVAAHAQHSRPARSPPNHYPLQRAGPCLGVIPTFRGEKVFSPVNVLWNGRAAKSAAKSTSWDRQKDPKSTLWDRQKGQSALIAGLI